MSNKKNMGKKYFVVIFLAILQQETVITKKLLTTLKNPWPYIWPGCSKAGCSYPLLGKSLSSQG